MEKTALEQKEIRKLIFTTFLILVTSFCLGIFLFDCKLVLYCKNKITIYTNYQNLIPFLKNSIFSFLGLSLFTFILSCRLKKIKNHQFLDLMKKQVFTFTPLIFLAYGRYFFDKAVKLFVIIPLFPSLIILVLTAVFYLNLKLHSDFSPFRRGFLLLKQNYNLRRKILLSCLIFILMIIFLHHQINRKDFHRFTAFKSFEGDEPRYLRLAQSLAIDGDIDVSNNSIALPDEDIEETKKEIISSGSRKFGHFSIIGLDGGIYHTHMPGLSLLIFPGYILDQRIYLVVPERAPPNLNFLPLKLYFTRLSLMILAISVILLLSRLLFRFFNSFFLLGALLLLFLFNSPFPNFSLKLYPEVAASFFCLLALNAILFPFKYRWLNFILIILGISYIPWLSQRLIGLALGLYLAFVLHEIISRTNFKRILIISFMLFLTSLPYFYYFYSITGSPLPNSMVKLFGYQAFRLNTLPLGFFGNIFHWSKGMIWIYPWTILALVGIYWGFKVDKKRMPVIFTAFITYYLMASASIPWHGMVREPARYITSLFPILLFFCAYTLISFYKRPSSAQLFLYIVFFFAVFLHKKFLFLAFNFDISYVKHSDFISILYCSIILFTLYLSTFLGDKWAEKKMDFISLKSIQKFQKNIHTNIQRKTNYFSLKPLRNSAVCLLILAQLIYIFLFIKNWNTKNMAMSLFSSLNKISASSDFLLWKKENPSRLFKKNEARFNKIFRNVNHFQIDQEQTGKYISLTKPLFYEKVPSGCYQIDLKTNNLLLKKTTVELNYLGKTRKLTYKNSSKKEKISTKFLIFKNTFLPSCIRIKFQSPPVNKTEGNMEIYPTPCAVYGKELIVRPKRKHKSIKRQGEGQYSLPLIVNLQKAPKKYNFFLYLLGTPEETQKKEELLGFNEKHFVRKKEKVNIQFKLPPGSLLKKAKLALLIKDEKENPLNCKSILFITNNNYWILPKKQAKKKTRNFSYKIKEPKS